MTRVFISHQSKDTPTAKAIAEHLFYNHNIDYYLDDIDPYIGKPGEDLAEHLRKEMSKCTQLLAVVSEKTKLSQWVPWEIGIATEKDFPLATYAADGVKPQEFLQKWPYLRTFMDLDAYARASRLSEQTYKRKRSANISESASKNTATRDFYTFLRYNLGQ